MQPAVLLREAMFDAHGEAIVLDRETTLGGGHDAIDVGASGLRAVIAWTDDAWWVRAIGAPVLVDDLAVERAPLHHGASLAAERWHVRFLLGDLASARLDHRHVASVTDGLTGVLTRRVAYRRLESMAQGAVMMVDVDRLKQINDRYGFLGGELALKRTARIVREKIRWPSLVARYAGDEFLVISPDPDLAPLRSLAETIRRAAEPPFEFDGEAINATVSIGLAGHEGQVSPTLRAVDDAVGQAKTQGRNRIIG